MASHKGQFQPGHAKVGGSKKGSINKLTDEVRKLAKDHGPAAIQRLVAIMEQTDDLKAAGTAAKEILERAYGRSSQALGDSENAPKLKIVITGDDAKL